MNTDIRDKLGVEAHRPVASVPPLKPVSAHFHSRREHSWHAHRMLRNLLVFVLLTVLLSILLAALDWVLRSPEIWPGGKLGSLTILFLLAAAAFAALWQLAWLALAVLSRTSALPLALRRGLNFAVNTHGSALARRALAAGAGTLAAGALIVPAASASQTPTLWPDTLDSSPPAEVAGLEEPAFTPGVPLWPSVQSTPAESQAAAQSPPEVESSPVVEAEAPPPTLPERPSANRAPAQNSSATPAPKAKGKQKKNPQPKPTATAATQSRSSRPASKSLERSASAPRNWVPSSARPGISAPVTALPRAAVQQAPKKQQARDTYPVQPGDSLWQIAATNLGVPQPTDAEIDAAWRRLHSDNYALIGDQPDLIHPGQELDLTGFALERGQS